MKESCSEIVEAILREVGESNFLKEFTAYFVFLVVSCIVAFVYIVQAAMNGTNVIENTVAYFLCINIGFIYVVFIFSCCTNTHCGFRKKKPLLPQ